MKIFGKTLSEYVSFTKLFLCLIAIVGIARLVLSLAGVQNSTVKWLSISGVVAIGLVYYSIRVHTSGFGSYKQLLPVVFLQSVTAQSIIIAGIVIAIFSGRDNIFSAPEYAGGQDGKNWIHVAAHLVLGLTIGPLVAWIVGCLLMWVTKKAAPRG